MLTSLLFWSLTLFSQSDTTIESKSFPIPVVRAIVKDLLGGDLAKSELKLTEKQLQETEKKVILKDSVINTLRLKETNYLTIIDGEKQKYQIMENYSKKLEVDLKKEKVKNKFKSIFGTGAIVLLTFFLIQK